MQINDPRIKSQVRAALRFWVALAKCGGTHPSRHPDAATELDGHQPMTVREIEALLDQSEAASDYVTIPKAAKENGIGYRTLKRQIEHDRVDPVTAIAGTPVYTPESLDNSIRQVLWRKWYG